MPALFAALFDVDIFASKHWNSTPNTARKRLVFRSLLNTCFVIQKTKYFCCLAYFACSLIFPCFLLIFCICSFCRQHRCVKLKILHFMFSESLFENKLLSAMNWIKIAKNDGNESKFVGSILFLLFAQVQNGGSKFLYLMQFFGRQLRLKNYCLR